MYEFSHITGITRPSDVIHQFISTILNMFVFCYCVDVQMGLQAVSTFEENLFYLVEPIDAAESLVQWVLGGMKYAS
jgi:hypothetical protein